LETPSSLHPGKEIFGIPNNRRSVSNIVVLKASSASSSETTSTTTPSSSYNKTLDSEWNIPGLKKEVDRLILRAHKKISKLHLQIQNNNNNESVPNAEPPSIIDKQPELESWQERVRNLNLLQEIMANIQQKQHDVVLPPNIAQLAIDLRVHDRPPPRPERGPGKTKQPNNNDEPNNRSNKDSSAPRKPYRRYYSKDNIEIRVGKKAIDNELVTLDPEHRNNWWMHASGCPGSHVVIRWNIDRGPPPESVVMDAAALAARQSKARNQSNVRVSMTPCRDIRKLPGTPTGTVHLTGAVRTISVNRKDAQTRCDRLDQTVLIN
jgi:predicted ribosome quality control (RQC) complex YloA/Tae2 family protein